MELTVNDMTREDIAPITEINKLCFTRPWSADALGAETQKDDAVFLTARADGEICGYGGFNYVLDEGYIANIAVHPNIRRQGVARRLLTELAARADALDLSFLTLEVRVSNLAAQRLYASAGFREVGRRKNFYEEIREDALIMTKYLKLQEGEENED